ncbi:MAG: hypothetical protein H8E12_00775, partial [Rhodobacteraceae bacterium]|nr:hypothetical protein [Paracoccaceae bacterium]
MPKYNPIVGDKWRYNPESPAAFKLSRTKIELFCKCERCFYLEVRLGFREPSGPGWAINSAVDTLLKKEMDYCRKEDRPHGLFKEYNLNIKPFHHPDIEQWQNSFKGIQSVEGNPTSNTPDLARFPLLVRDISPQSLGITAPRPNSCRHRRTNRNPPPRTGTSDLSSPPSPP